jgi:two-component system sensor histidine kinase/response regulator
MKLLLNKSHFSSLMLILYMAVSFMVLSGGYLYYKYQKNELLSDTREELSAIADLKIRQITQWRFERLGNAGFIGDDRYVAELAANFISDSLNLKARYELFLLFNSLIDNFDYKQVLLLDTAGAVKFSFPDNKDLAGTYPGELIRKVVSERKIMMSDLHITRKDSLPHLDLIVPVILFENDSDKVKGLFDLIVDPGRILYPLVQTWPSPSKSAETLIVRRDSNEITFLNEPRHYKASGVGMRLPISDSRLPSAMALQGIAFTMSGIDYRNVPVVASMKKIPGTDWYMVAKIDRSEVFSSLNRQMRMVVTILILFLVALGMFIGFLSRNQRARFYREKYEAELERLALVKHFEYILKYANDIIYLADKDLKIIEANDHALETYQYTRQEFIGMKLEKIWGGNTLNTLVEQIKMVERNGSATFETFQKRKDGTLFPVEISSRLVNIEGIKYFQTIGRDITERKIAEESLRESEARFRKIFEESPFCMLISAKNFEIIRANISFCKMTGYDEHELKMLTFMDFTHPENLAHDELGLIKLVAGDIPVYQTEKRYIRKDGSIVWGSTTVSLIRDNDGEVRYFLVMVEDITKRKEAELARDGSYSLLKATLESTADGILVVDNDGRIVEFNRKFIEMWNLPPELLDSKNDADLLAFVKDQLKDEDSFISNVKSLYNNPEAVTSDLLEFRDGRFFERYSQPQKINGVTNGRVWSFRDITASKKAEAEIIAAKEKAEESDRLKTAFLHNISHEIRTPMNAIIGFSNLLRESDLEASEHSQYVEIINQSSNQLLSIINDIVDIANVESGQVKMNYTNVNLNVALGSLCEQYTYKERKPEIPINFFPGLPDNEAFVRADRTKLIQVLSNLINNALKFTTAGQIDFGYTIDKNFIEFYVKDTGVGIPAEHTDRIFDRFYQVDGTGSRQYGGTGLGLSICKAYVELMGGIIRVESKEEKGSCFLFTIPYSRI